MTSPLVARRSSSAARDDALVVGVARREQPHDLRLIEAIAALSALDDALDRWVHEARMDSGHVRDDLGARRPIVVAREALGVAETTLLACAISGAVQTPRSRI